MENFLICFKLVHVKLPFGKFGTIYLLIIKKFLDLLSKTFFSISRKPMTLHPPKKIQLITKQDLANLTFARLYFNEEIDKYCWK